MRRKKHGGAVVNKPRLLPLDSTCRPVRTAVTGLNLSHQDIKPGTTEGIGSKGPKEGRKRRRTADHQLLHTSNQSVSTIVQGRGLTLRT